MATESTREYLDVANKDELPILVQEYLTQDRELYDKQKALRAKICAALNDVMTIDGGKVITGIAFTRWGQLQVIVDHPKAAKASNAKPRKTLSDYMVEREAEGRQV